jgi:DNA-binding transcriptional LysR family regulator
MACPVALLDVHVGGMVAAFMAEHPHVDVHLDATNRRVDVIGEGIDIAIRVRPPPLQDSDLVMRVLAERSQCLVASPALVQQLGLPQGPADLSGYPSLDLGTPQNEHVWTLYRPRRRPGLRLPPPALHHPRHAGPARRRRRRRGPGATADDDGDGRTRPRRTG